MNRRFFLSLLTSLGLTASAFAAESNIGVVNFGSCVTDSKLGKQEQAAFESLKKQMSTLLEDTEKQLQDLSAKFNDQEYLDGLSPEAEQEHKIKFEALNQDMQRYQNQYYQVLNQANMRIIQSIGSSIAQASEKIAKDKKLTMVVNKEACFFFAPTLEVTSDVIAEMDKTFSVQDSSKQLETKAEKSSEPAKK
ncbi:MAG: OmpH family outer membrane protein [Simkania sp.]|nr:OmpH family outer membrane protein [Simkania sp.]